MEKQKEYNLRYLLAKVLLHEETRRTGSDSGRTNATKTVSDVFRHRSRTRKSYCRTRSDVGSERVKALSCSYNCLKKIKKEQDWSLAGRGNWKS
jgi:hypothetical protein